MMIYCRIHLMRDIEAKFKQHKHYDLMRKILQCSFKTELNLIFNQLLIDSLIRD